MFLPTGEADLAVQQVPELLHVPGVEIVGPLPGDLHMVTVFVAGIPSDSAQPVLATALIESLRTPEAKALFRAKGLEPG
jgi:molybdate transport system substrate-binding protein